MYNVAMKKTIKIQKDSQFISIYASGELTVTQKKIYNGLIFMTKEMLNEDSERTKFKISLQDLMDCVSEKDLNYVHIVDNLRALKHIIVEYNVLGKNKKNKIDMFSLIGDVRIENGFIYYDFGFIALEYIKKPLTYAYLDLKIMQGLDSKHSISLYEILQDYKSLKAIDIELDKFKKAMDIKDTEYKRFGDFRDYVIDPAIDEINNKTDLFIQYEKITKGRKVTGLKFLILDTKKETKLNNKKSFINFVRKEKANVSMITTSHENGDIQEIACSTKGLLYDKQSGITFDKEKSNILWVKLYELYQEDRLPWQKVK